MWSHTCRLKTSQLLRVQVHVPRFSYKPRQLQECLQSSCLRGGWLLAGFTIYAEMLVTITTPLAHVPSLFLHLLCPPPPHGSKPLTRSKISEISQWQKCFSELKIWNPRISCTLNRVRRSSWKVVRVTKSSYASETSFIDCACRMNHDLRMLPVELLCVWCHSLVA